MQQQLLAQQQRGEERGNEFFEEGLEGIQSQMGQQAALEKRRKNLEIGLGSDVQLEHGGILDYRADEVERGREGLLRIQGTGKLTRGERKAKKQIQGLYQAAYDADAAGDHERAEQLRAQADQAFEESGLSGRFTLGEKFGPQKQKGSAVLQSAGGMLAGETLRDARELMDPDSERSKAFRRSLTERALAEVDAAEERAGRALATGERTAARGIRDAALAGGGARALGAESALAARSAERFAGQRADLATQAGAARAQIHAEAAKYYETFKRAWSVDAAQAARDWLNDQSFVRDSYRQMQISLQAMHAQLSATAGAANLGLSGDAMRAGASVYAADKEAEAQEKAARQEMWGSMIGGILGIASAGFSNLTKPTGATTLTVGKGITAPASGGPAAGGYRGFDFSQLA